MNLKEEKYKTLLEQRKQIIDQIQLNNKSFHTSIFSILTVYTASYFIGMYSEDNLSLASVFIMSQITFALICYVMGLLFAMNNDRDLIRAIDKYIEENYEIDTLFWQGELSYRHINRKSVFSLLTFIAAVIAIIFVIGMIIFRFDEIYLLIKQYMIIAIVFFVEALSIIILIVRNLRYKMTGKSVIMDDCYNYLYRNTCK